MSIGPTGPSGYSLPSSIVGSANRNLNETAQAKAEAAQQNADATQARFSVRDNEDVMETGLSADRDVDGRLPYDLPPEEQPEEEVEAEANSTNPAEEPHRSIDAEGERGRTLDLEA